MPRLSLLATRTHNWLGRLLLAALFALAIPVAAHATATTNGPVFPTPGGTTFSLSGPADDLGKTGGLTLTLEDFDFGGDVDQVWWGPAKDLFFTGPAVGSSMDGAIDSAGESMTYTSGGVWIGTTEIDLFSGGLTAVDTRYTATIVTNGSAFFDASTVGIDTAVSPVVSEVLANPFEVHQIMEARFSSGGAWTPFIEFFEAQTTSPSAGPALMSVQGGLYYTPEPSTALLLGFGALGMAMRRRARA